MATARAPCTSPRGEGGGNSRLIFAGRQQTVRAMGERGCVGVGEDEGSVSIHTSLLGRGCVDGIVLTWVGGIADEGQPRPAQGLTLVCGLEIDQCGAGGGGG